MCPEGGGVFWTFLLQDNYFQIDASKGPQVGQASCNGALRGQYSVWVLLAVMILHLQHIMLNLVAWVNINPFPPPPPLPRSKKRLCMTHKGRWLHSIC